MSCKSPSLEKVVQKSDNAKKQVEELNKQLLEFEVSNKTEFERRIADHGKGAKISDFKKLIFNSAIKTEYSHEFSLDKIAPIIAKTLEAIASSLTGSVMQVLTSPKAISSYSDLVVSISEAAKSNSTASNSLNFSANRIAPGVYAFLSANSVSIKDDETFGEESVTATSILYSLHNSIDDIKNTAEFEFAYLDSELLLKFKHIQVGYADELANGLITIAVWNEKDMKIEQIIKGIQERLNRRVFNNILATASDDKTPVDGSLFNMALSKTILEASIVKFENRGLLYKQPLNNAKLMLSNPLFNL